jgi:ABC-type nitrate/sulfonate/bicarbonate transport system substrate-binding protein
MRRSIRAVTLYLSVFASLSLTVFDASAATSLAEFPIGYSSNGGTYGFIGLVEQQRLLDQQGIRPQFVYIGGPQITQAFMAGDIRMMIVAAASPIRAAAQGAEVKFIGGAIDKEVSTLIASPTIKSRADLKGGKLAIDRLGDYTDFLARVVLEKLKLIPEKDVTLVQIGGQTSRFAALKSGAVQATFVAPPLTLLAKRAGLNALVDLANLGIPSSSASFVVLRATQQRYAAELYKALLAIGKGLRIYKSNKAAAIKGLAQFMHIDDPAALEETWKVHAPLYKDVPSPSTEGIRIVKEFLGKADSNVAKLGISSLIDTQYVSRLEKEIEK